MTGNKGRKTGIERRKMADKKTADKKMEQNQGKTQQENQGTKKQGNINYLCGICNEIIKEEEELSIECEGWCEVWFHKDCVHLSTEEFDIVSSEDCKLRWFCENCDKKIKICGKENESVNLIVSQLISENIKLNSELLKCKVENTELKCKIEEKSMCCDNTKFDDGKKQVKLWSDLLKSNKDKVSSNIKPKETVIIKKVQEGEIENMQEILKKNIKPHELNITINKMRMNKDGHVMVDVEDKESKEKLVEEINRKIGDKLVASQKEERKSPLEKSRRIEFKVYVEEDTLPPDDEELINNIIQHNKLDEVVQNCSIKVVKRWFVRGNVAEVVVLDIDEDSYKYFMEKRQQKLILNWSSIPIRKNLNVKQCFKCLNYGHFATQCKLNKQSCKYCAGEHNYKECQENNKKCCINCSRKNNKFNAQLNVNHFASDNTCPVYLNALDTMDKIFYE